MKMRFPDCKYLADRERGMCSPNVLYLRNKLEKAENLFRKELYAHYGCVNAIEFDKDGQFLVSGGDDRRVLLWNVEKALHDAGKPMIMKSEHTSNVFCLGFDNHNSKIFSGGNDEQVIVHDAQTGAVVDVFRHEEAVYGLSIDPLNDNVFASACDDGRVLIWDIREPASTEPFCLASYSSAFQAVMYNPVEARLLATANSKEGVSLWDIRQPKNWLIKYGGTQPVQSCMSVRFNMSGTQILALRRRLPPILFDIHNPSHKCQFDHPGYYNSCTMKTCCFAGDNDQFVLSGSDDFNLYMWRIPPEGNAEQTWVDEAHMVLKGHRSIVNQVRFNPSNFLLASSGVEKIVKLWSPFQIPGSSGGLKKHSPTVDRARKIYTHEEYFNLVIRSGQVMTHDYSDQSMKEDSRMMAFFDSLVQREIEGLTSDSSMSGGNSDSWLFNVVESVSLHNNVSSSDASSDDELPQSVCSDAVPEPPVPGSSTNNGSLPLSPSMATRGSTSWNLSNSQEAAMEELAPDSPLQNDDDGSNQQGSMTESISWLIAQKRQQLLHSALKFRMRQSKMAKKRLSALANGATRTSKTLTASAQASESSSASLESTTSSSSLDTEEDSAAACDDHQKLPASSSMNSGSENTDRRKLLRKRRMPTVQEISDSDSDSDDHAPLLSHRKRHCFNRAERAGGSRNGSDVSKMDDGHKSEAVCVAVQQTQDSPAPSENGETSGSVSTPDSGIALQNYEKSSPPSHEAPSTSTSDSSDLAPVRFKRLKTCVEKASRNPRNYRSFSNDKSD